MRKSSPYRYGRKIFFSELLTYAALQLTDEELQIALKRAEKLRGKMKPSGTSRPPNSTAPGK